MLSLTVQNLGDVAVFRCTGRIEAGNDTALRKAVTAHTGASLVVLDLAAVTGMDAAGLGALANLKAWANTSGRRLKLMNVTPPVAELLQLTGLSTVFEVCSVREMLDLICRAASASVAGVKSPLEIHYNSAAA